MDLSLSARRIDPRTALEWGLVNYVSMPADLRRDALQYAEMISTRNAEAIAAMKKLALRSVENGLVTGLQQERDEALQILRSANVDEGLRAFKEKRTPKFA